ncbi:hypothetical protein VSR68_40980 [Paraburkholderia phymatum]|uniref:hypothetical protein n=1 Tax=Paraburkholderia TaxID=1822464 RepID=UPI0031819155
MWYTDCDLSEAIGGCVADVTENQVTPPVPAPGEYAEREARPARLLLYPLLAESNEAVSSPAKVDPAERQNTLLAVNPDAFWRVWTLLFGQPTDTRPSKSLVAQVAAALFGSRTAPGADYLAADFDAVNSRELAREYRLARLRELVASRRHLAQCFAAARAFLLRHIARATVETGSTAAIAKRMTPLGAPPQIA